MSAAQFRFPHPSPFSSPMITLPSYVPTTGYRQTIEGQSVPSAESFQVTNPATGAPFADCPSASQEQLEVAIRAARKAQAGWARTSYESRRDALHALAAAMESDIEVLAGILTAEQGKPLARAREEVFKATQQMRLLSSIAIPDQTGVDSAGHRFTVRYRPVGVVGAITPWNMPVILAIWKIAHALYCGNAVVLKPSPYTPLSTLRLGELSQRVLPPGVLNIVAGGDDLGRWISEHPHIDKVSFTGSVRTGKRVMVSAAGTLKRVTLELGGNDAAIVLKDLDPRRIAGRLYSGAFSNAGQICMAIKRLYVEAPIFDSVCHELERLVEATRVGNGFDPEVTMGPVQNAMQYRIVSEVLDEARQDPQAKILGGSQRFSESGYFVAPRVVAHPSEHTRVVHEETFGPLLPVMKFDDAEEVIAKANDSRYGLGGSVWSQDTDRAEQLASRLEVGTAWINHHMGSDPLMPFGGLKESGIGREMSALGLHHYMEAQVLSFRPLP